MSGHAEPSAVVDYDYVAAAGFDGFGGKTDSWESLALAFVVVVVVVNG